jgi:prolyl oligopeptidase
LPRAPRARVLALATIRGAKYTSAQKLGGIGTSGGGLLVAATTVRRPDLFGASVPIAGVHDLVRFPLFGQGAGWQGDTGSPDDAAELAALHDVRVPPLHSYELAAALQAAQAAAASVVLRVQISSGHGGGSVLSRRIEQEAEFLNFLASALGLHE